MMKNVKTGFVLILLMLCPILVSAESEPVVNPAVYQQAVHKPVSAVYDTLYKKRLMQMLF